MSGAAASLLLAVSLLPIGTVEGSGSGPTEGVGLSPRALKMTEGRLTARFDNVPLGLILDALADLTAARIDVEVEPDERVTGEFIEVPLEQIVRRLLPSRQLVTIYEHTRERPHVVAVHAYTRSGSRARRNREDTATAGTGAHTEASDGAHTRAWPDGETRRLAIADDLDAAALRRGMDDLDSGVRERAARALGRTGDERAIKPLSRALRGDEDAVVREAAAKALGHLWSDAAVDILGEALRTDPARAVREAAAWALGNIGGADGVSSLVAALRDPRGSVRETAVAALGAIGGESAQRALIEVSMTDRDPWVRAEAAASLEGISD